MTESISTEFIVVLDRATEAPELSVEDFVNSLDPRIAQGLTWLEAPRFTMAADWRAGWIRNVGAEYSRATSGSYLVFLDADCEIADTRQVAAGIVGARHGLIYTSLIDLTRKGLSSQETAPFQVCSSRLLIVRRSLFENLGGFSDAFEEYGCEDNFFVWQASEFIRRGLPLLMAALPLETTRHLRTIVEKDDLLEKMIRMRRSSALCYRMSLDPRVHRHFFVSLGKRNSTIEVLVRFLFKSIAIKAEFRWILSPFLFLLTLSQLRDPNDFLKLAIWPLRDGVQWRLRVGALRTIFYIKCLYHFIIKCPYHFIRLHGWRIKQAIFFPFAWLNSNRWRIRVLLGKISARLWFFPVAYLRLKKKIKFSRNEENPK